MGMDKIIIKCKAITIIKQDNCSVKDQARITRNKSTRANWSSNTLHLKLIAYQNLPKLVKPLSQLHSLST